MLGRPTVAGAVGVQGQAVHVVCETCVSALRKSVANGLSGYQS